MEFNQAVQAGPEIVKGHVAARVAVAELLTLSESAAGDADHGPADHDLVVMVESFVVADAGAVSSDPGQSPIRRRPEQPTCLISPA
jgi:hypothetical protein